MKKLLSLLFTAAIVFTLTAPVFAYSASSQEPETKTTKTKKTHAKKTKATKEKKTKDTSKM